MKVHTITKEHPSQTIAVMGSVPFQKQPIAPEGKDAKMQGNILAAETIALLKVETAKWQGIALNIINLTTDGREAYMKALDKQLAAMREDTENTIGADEKAAKKLVASATVNISRCRTIAKAFNAGGTMEGMAEFHGVKDPENLGFILIYNYAQTFSKATAGRKPDTLLVKLGKWIEAQKKGITDDATAEDRALMDELVRLHNRLVG